MPSTAIRLVHQSQDAALTAVQVFNNPLIRFKSETFIVLMNVAWMYLLHAHYRKTSVEYRYFHGDGKGRRYDRTANGSYKYWDLRKCLSVPECPIDNETKQNLLFLIGLRDEIAHHMSPTVDQYASARYQACCLNYNRCVKELFGEKQGIDQHLSYSLQFSQLSRDQLAAPQEADLPKAVRSYITQFDNGLTEGELNSQRFAYRMLFVPKLVGKPGQADEVIEFFKPDSDITETVNNAYVALKEVERPKFLPGSIVQMMKTDGYPRFTMTSHTRLWQQNDAKNPGKGYGVTVAGAWYWYQSWVDFVRQYCQAHAADFQ